MAVVALLHPGSMGSRIGGELAKAGHDVRWLAVGRSAATHKRAEAERLTATSEPAELLEGAEYAVSICPPQAARDVARLVSAAGFRGTYVEANPVSGTTLAGVARIVERTGAVLVDAGVVGPPPRAGSRTQLYLSGPQQATRRVSDLVAATALSAVVLGERVGAASVAKQAYALFNKGRLVLAAMAADLAEEHGVLDVLAGEHDRQGAQVLAELAELRSGLHDVGWRWAPEFAEIADSLTAAGMDGELAGCLAAALRRRSG